MAGGGGGAWKVAYADFVTAMMALFMVLWISAQDKEILIATSQYFQSPFKSPMEASSGVMSGGAGSSFAQSAASSSSVADITFLNQLARDFQKMLEVDDANDDKPVEINVTNDGLRVTVFDRSERPVFRRDSAEFTEWGEFVVQNLAWLLDRNTFKVRIDGHTAAGFAPERPEYSAWELSADRANSTRRALLHYAVPAGKFERVTGFADTVPLPGQPAEAPANQRIELSLVIVNPLRPSP